jgi:DNA-binding NarL/FixJ family response regulator
MSHMRLWGALSGCLGTVTLMRAIRMIYVENDPALQGIVSSLLTGRSEVELLFSASSSSEVLDLMNGISPDVALIDLDLGQDSLNGIELGLVLRGQHPDMGVVIFTQHVVPDFIGSLPEVDQMGWSFLEKRADLDLDVLITILGSTARGLNVVDPSMERQRRAQERDSTHDLSTRQREIMALLASGQDATSIATVLGLNVGSIRKELSRAYSVLVPDAQPGTDVRTVAILRYLRATRTYPSGPVDPKDLS